MTPNAIADFDQRLGRLPVHRVRRWADYWALRSIEHAHVMRWARQWQLTGKQREEVDDWWLTLVEHQVHGPLKKLRQETVEHRMRGMPQSRNRVLFQLLFNTIGPGGRTWFANRYTTLRLLTFRFRWRA
jgi:hypothetical protein